MNKKSERTGGSWWMPALIFLLMSGCTNYGTVSERACEHAHSLYSVCNTRSVSRLGCLKEILDADGEAELLSATEIRWLRSIIDQAESGNWDAAASAARQMMLDQVKH